MERQHFSRKKRQLNNLVKKLKVLIQNSIGKYELAISEIRIKIKLLLNSLISCVSKFEIKKILGPLAIFIGISMPNTASAQYFQSPVTNPFGITPGSNIIANIPAIGDLDGDGDLDLLAQEYNDYTSSMDFKYSENIGNANTPQFSNSITNPYNLIGDTVPRFHNLVDLDGDGDLDILSLDAEELSDTINYNYGNVSYFRYYENIGTPTIPVFDTVITNPFGLVTDSAWAIADLVDIDNDGDFDILISSNSEYDSYTYYGYTYGMPPKFKFIENIGNTNTPIFTAPVDNPFGLTIPGRLSSPSFMDYDNDGDFDLFVGAMDTSTSTYYNYFASIFYFENTGTNTVPQFAIPLNNPFGLTTVDQFSFLEIMDLDGDGDDDMLVGEYGGNLLYFENTAQPLLSWDCINYNCTDPGNGNGQFTNLSDCQTSCIVPVSYNCISPNNCTDPGDGSGLYSSLMDCQSSCNTVSISNLTDNIFSVYPNPIKDIITIKSDKKIISIRINDIIGKNIYSEIKTMNKINVQELNKGIYFMIVEFIDGTSIKQKIIK